jgi:hypothetical protein
MQDGLGKRIEQACVAYDSERDPDSHYLQNQSGSSEHSPHAIVLS